MGKRFHKNTWNLVSVLILFIPNRGLEEKAIKVYSFPKYSHSHFSLILGISLTECLES